MCHVAAQDQAIAKELASSLYSYSNVAVLQLVLAG